LLYDPLFDGRLFDDRLLWDGRLFDELLCDGRYDWL
jgi:hypothetical protein